MSTAPTAKAAAKATGKPKAKKAAAKAAAKTEVSPTAAAAASTAASAPKAAKASAGGKKAAATPKAPKAAAAKKAAKPKTNKRVKKVQLKFTLDCTSPVEDGIMDAAQFEKFLHDRIKVNGKAGALGENVTIARDKTKIHVTADIAMSKRYMKYLTKKFLKKNNLRDWLHVVAVNKTTYELKYFNIQDDDDDEAGAA